MTDTAPPFGTSEWHAMFLDRFDRVTVQIAFAEHPSQPAREVFVVEFDEPGWERDWLTGQLLDLFRGEQGMPRYPHQLRIQQTYTGWGAAGAGEQLLLLVAQSALAGTVASASWAAVQGLTRRLLAMRKSQIKSPPMDRDTAESRARWQVQTFYTISPHLLTVTKETRDTQAGSWEFTLQDQAGTRYTVLLGALDGEQSTLRLSREQ